MPASCQGVSGSVSFSQTGKVLTVTNSNGAIINCSTFSIGADETVYNLQTSASSRVLYRVLANDPSILLGTLSSNGKIWLINPAGIMVGQGARIDVAGFVASTLNIRDEDFLANRLNFQNASGIAGGKLEIEKGAQITTPSGGSVYLIAPNIVNNGVINAPNGEVLLAAGQTVQLIDTGTPGVKVEITGAEGNVTNLGQIISEAGRIGMAGVLIKNSGEINASSVVNEGGRIFLKASQDAYVDGDGRIVATGTKGGRVEVLGNRVAVMDNAQIDVSGDNGGGTALIGGDYQGKSPDIQNATITYFGPKARIKADALKNGNGGKVIVWSDDTTRALGAISARGGINGGDGGFVETSGHRYLDFQGKVDTSAPQGKAGTLLLDPSDIEIKTTATPPYNYDDLSYGGTIGVYGGSYVFGANNSGTAAGPNGTMTPSQISWSSLLTQLDNGNVVITTNGGGGSGNITVQDSNTFSKSSSLTLLAHNTIQLNGSIINTYGGTGGNLNFVAGWTGSSIANPLVTTNTGDIAVGNANISTNGSINMLAGADVKINPSLTTMGKVTSKTGMSIEAKRDIIVDNTTPTANPNNGPAGFFNTTSGTQAIKAGRDLKLIAGAYGGAAISNLGTGQQTVNAVNIILNGGTVNSSNSAVISSYGNQQITATGEIALYGGASGSGNYAKISHQGSGNQTITAATLAAYGGDDGYNNSAEIENQTGDQSITLSGTGTALKLKGGLGTSYNNSARIWQKGSGAQSITLTGANVTVLLEGGAGTGSNPTNTECPTCSIYRSGNGASIANEGSGDQTINFSADGNNYLTLTGGTGGNSNEARIENRGTGAQYIFGGASLASLSYGANPTITLNNGASGGNAEWKTSTQDGVSAARWNEFGNDASIESKGSQTIYAKSITLDARNAAAYGGAMITGKTQTINVYGGVTMYGGAGVKNTATTGATDYLFKNIAVIGNDTENHKLTLNVGTGADGGNLKMYGGDVGAFGGSQAMIGTYRYATNTTITAKGEIDLNTSTYTGARIGSMGGFGGTGLGGTLSLTTSYSTSGTSDIKLAKGVVGTGTSGTTALSAYGGISQDALGRIQSDILSLATTKAGSAISLLGENMINTLNASSLGALDFKNVKSFTAGTVTSDGNVSLTTTDTYSYGGNITIGTITAASSSVTISSDRAIYDDNDSSTKITATDLTLSSSKGGVAGGLAISADTAVSGNLQAYVNGTATNGGIRVSNTGAQPTSIVLTDEAINGNGVNFYNSGNLTLNGNTTFKAIYGGDIFVTSGGDLTWSNSAVLNTSATTYGDLYLGASGTLSNGGASRSYSGNLFLVSPTINISGGTVSSDKNLFVLATRSMESFAPGGEVNKDNSQNLNLNGTLTLTGGGLEATDNLAILTGNINASSLSHIKATNYDVGAIVSGNIKLTGGSYIHAGQDVKMLLLGPSSTLTLNEAPGAASYVLANAPSTIYLGFLQRSTDGIVIDGAQTVSSQPGGSGLFVVDTSTPAVRGAGLQLAYFATPSGVSEATNSAVATIISTATPPSSPESPPTVTPPPPPPPPGTGGGMLLANTNQSIGGAAGTFGGGDAAPPGTGTGPTPGAPSGGISPAGSEPSPGPAGPSARASGGEGDKPAGPGATGDKAAGDKPTGDKSAGDKPANGKKDESKKDDEKKDDKKKDEGPSAKKDDKPVTKKAPTCS